MRWKEYSDLKGKHAIFSPSNSVSYTYTDEQIQTRIHNSYRTALGTEMHAFAASQIVLGTRYKSKGTLCFGLKTYIYSKYEQLENLGKGSLEYGKTLIEELAYLPPDVFETLRNYISDGIGYRMRTEQVVYYSKAYYGTADAISFKDNQLRIHDLKTGNGPTHIEQLYNYAALFCLDYDICPEDIEIEVCIYQYNEILVDHPTAENIRPIMDRIVSGTEIVKYMQFRED